MKKILKITSIIVFILFVGGCSDFLEEEVYTQYDPDTYLQTEAGINSVLVASYNHMHAVSNQRERLFTLSEFPGDIMWEWGGGFEALANVFINYAWDPSVGAIRNPWRNWYQSIRNANSLLDNIDKATSLSPEKVKQLKAEATFIRAADYYFLWDFYGPVPIITTSEELNLEPTRPSAEEFENFLAGELQSAANDLPKDQGTWGKADKGSAYALLGRFYMNTHQWQKAADACEEVMKLNKYSLFAGDLANMFAVQNERNSEIILASPSTPNARGNAFMAHAFPPNYPVLPNWINYGAQYCVYNDWVTTYHTDDKRRGWFLWEYTDKNGDYHDLLDPDDKGRAVRCFKYIPDPDAVSQNHGNDIVMIRYAEVMLNLAEALNEINGPNQESVDLLNEVRTRAGIPDLALSDFGSKEVLREAILVERGWEFVVEGLRRSDLIRQGKLIERANARGVSAQAHHVLFPIPQAEMNSNPNLEQNTGY